MTANARTPISRSSDNGPLEWVERTFHFYFFLFLSFFSSFFELLKISFLDGWMVIRSRGKLPDFGEMILLDLIGVVKNNS